MSVVINTQFQRMYLSAALPERVSFSIQDADESAEVRVHVDHDLVFKTTLYATGNYLYLYDIRTIIEDAIRDNGNASGECAVSISDGYRTETSRDFQVLISDFVFQNAEQVLANRFLTTRTSFRIYRHGRQCLTWFSPYTGYENDYIEAVVLPEGATTPQVITYNEPRRTVYFGVVSFYYVYADKIAQYFEDDGKLLSFTIHRGARSMTFYVTDEVPDQTFCFLNAFNATEYFELYGVTAIKQKVERSEATILREHIFYDQSTETTHEVETAALPYEEAVWLNQMLTSRSVSVQVLPNRMNEILISDSNPEISDADNHQNRIKFSWRLARNAPMIDAPLNAQYFTEEYKSQFQ